MNIRDGKGVTLVLGVIINKGLGTKVYMIEGQNESQEVIFIELGQKSLNLIFISAFLVKRAQRQSNYYDLNNLTTFQNLSTFI